MTPYLRKYLSKPKTKEVTFTLDHSSQSTDSIIIDRLVEKAADEAVNFTGAMRALKLIDRAADVDPEMTLSAIQNNKKLMKSSWGPYFESQVNMRANGPTFDEFKSYEIPWPVQYRSIRVTKNAVVTFADGEAWEFPKIERDGDTLVCWSHVEATSVPVIPKEHLGGRIESVAILDSQRPYLEGVGQRITFAGGYWTSYTPVMTEFYTYWRDVLA